MKLLEQDACEPFKAAVHGVACGLAVVCGAYNAAALVQRRRGWHLAINVVLYAAVAAWEFQHVKHHRTCE